MKLIKVLLLASLLGGCVSSKVYKRDMQEVTEAFSVFSDLSMKMTMVLVDMKKELAELKERMKAVEANPFHQFQFQFTTGTFIMDNDHDYNYRNMQSLPYNRLEPLSGEIKAQQ